MGENKYSRKLHRTLSTSVVNGLPYVLKMRYHYFSEILVPSLEQLSSNARTNTDKKLLSRGYFLLGDVYDTVFDNPSLAITNYKKAIDIDPSLSAGWRELGSQYASLGKKKEANAALLMALELDPNDADAVIEFKCLHYHALSTSRSLRPSESSSTKAMSLLAKLDPKAALKSICNNKSTLAHQIRARAFGALKHNQRFLEEWRAIYKQKSRVHFAYADWFFMPTTVYHTKNIWLILKKMVDRLTPSSVIVIPDGLVSKNSGRVRNSERAATGLSELWKRVIAYQIKQISTGKIRRK